MRGSPAPLAERRQRPPGLAYGEPREDLLLGGLLPDSLADVYDHDFWNEARLPVCPGRSGKVKCFRMGARDIHSVNNLGGARHGAWCDQYTSNNQPIKSKASAMARTRYNVGMRAGFLLPMGAEGKATMQEALCSTMCTAWHSINAAWHRTIRADLCAER